MLEREGLLVWTEGMPEGFTLLVEGKIRTSTLATLVTTEIFILNSH